MEEVTLSSGNVYADLEYKNAEEMKMKAILVGVIGTLSLSYCDIAARLKITEMDVSEMFRGNFRVIDVESLAAFVQTIHYG